MTSKKGRKAKAAIELAQGPTTAEQMRTFCGYITEYGYRHPALSLDAMMAEIALPKGSTNNDYIGHVAQLASKSL